MVSTGIISGPWWKYRRRRRGTCHDTSPRWSRSAWDDNSSSIDGGHDTSYARLQSLAALRKSADSRASDPCSASSGNRLWVTRSLIPTFCLRAAGGVPAVALDSKGNLWVFQRKAAGSPQLYKFDSDHKLILQIGDDVIGHQDKAHGMAVDAEDNVWISDTNGATVMKLSPDGRTSHDPRCEGTPGRLG